MPNRNGRVRHLTVVPDLEESPDIVERESAEFDDEYYASSMALSAPVVMYTIRVTLDDVEPAVWRRFTVRSDLLLPEFHRVLHTVMGWTGTHAHRFRVPTPSGFRSYEIRSSSDEDDGSAVGENHVRVDALLKRNGDVATYEYDAGDGWEHTLELESSDGNVDDLRTTCVDGRRACPIESSGGPRSYQRLIGLLADPASEAYDELEDRVGPFDPENFDAVRVNEVLRAGAGVRSVEEETAAASPAIARLFGRASPAYMPALVELLPRCELTIESSIDLPVATVAMSKLLWLLDRVGDRGLQLVESKYLPPAVVEAMRDELDWGLGWSGTGVREADNHQANDLRNAAKRLGLIRVYRGTLVLTKVGLRYREDPVGLWRHCASRVPLGKEDHDQDAGTLFLVALASSAAPKQRNDMIVQTMQALGWRIGQFYDAQVAAQPTVDFLDLIGAHGPTFYFRSEVFDAPSWSRRFARDALRS